MSAGWNQKRNHTNYEHRKTTVTEQFLFLGTKRSYASKITTYIFRGMMERIWNYLDQPLLLESKLSKHRHKGGGDAVVSFLLMRFGRLTFRTRMASGSSWDDLQMLIFHQISGTCPSLDYTYISGPYLQPHASRKYTIRDFGVYLNIWWQPFKLTWII